jgi:hypothetical protein
MPHKNYVVPDGYEWLDKIFQKAIQEGEDLRKYMDGEGVDEALRKDELDDPTIIVLSKEGFTEVESGKTGTETKGGSFFGFLRGRRR